MSGHVLNLKAKHVDISINKINQIELAFPQTPAYQHTHIIAATSERYQNAQMNEK